MLPALAAAILMSRPDTSPAQPIACRQSTAQSEQCKRCSFISEMVHLAVHNGSQARSGCVAASVATNGCHNLMQLASMSMSRQGWSDDLLQLTHRDQRCMDTDKEARCADWQPSSLMQPRKVFVAQQHPTQPSLRSVPG